MYFTEMLEAKVPLNEHSYNALITAFADARRPDKIMELFRVAKQERHLNEVVGTQLLQVRQS